MRLADCVSAIRSAAHKLIRWQIAGVLIPSVVLVAALAQPASAKSRIQAGTMTLTGYSRIGLAQGSKGAVTVTVNGPKKDALFNALMHLTLVPSGTCVETINTFTVRFLLKSSTHPRYVVTEDECPTPGVVRISIAGRSVGDFKSTCTLKRAVLAALPSGRAEASRQELEHCS